MPSAPSVNGITGTHRHKEYYIHGGDLHIIADDTHFLVHSYFVLRESDYFRDLLNPTPHPAGEPKPGSDGSTALKVDASQEDLTTFLKVFYNPKFTYFENMSTENWITVLNLAHKWKFPEVKSLAIRELEKIDLDIVPRMAVYQKNGVDVRYIVPLYAKLCMREETPTLEEAKILGHETTTTVFIAREKLRAPNAGSADVDELKSPLPGEIGLDTILRTLTSVLKIEADISDFPDLNKSAANGQGSETAKSKNPAKTNTNTGKPESSNTKGKQSGRNTNT